MIRFTPPVPDDPRRVEPPDDECSQYDRDADAREEAADRENDAQWLEAAD